MNQLLEQGHNCIVCGNPTNNEELFADEEEQDEDGHWASLGSHPEPCCEGCYEKAIDKSR
jgi:hypothetical protein